MSREIFKYVEGSSFEMQIGNFGSVLILETTTYTDLKGNTHTSENWKHLEGTPDKDGYLQVRVPHVGIKFIHKLVAEAFIRKPTYDEYFPNTLYKDNYITDAEFQSKLEVNHIDGIRKNNRYDNLEWLTHRDNTQGERKHKKGNVKRKPVKVLDKDHKLVEICSSIADAGRKYGDVSKGGVCGAHISKCVRGLIPKYKGYYFLEHVEEESVNTLF